MQGVQVGGGGGGEGEPHFAGLAMGSCVKTSRLADRSGLEKLWQYLRGRPRL